jgi:acyl-CoA reductase-like NAD-dependent aldehyde dehydrogenase
MRVEKLVLAGRPSAGGAAEVIVRSPFDGREVARVARADSSQVADAADAANAARTTMAALSARQRAAILESAAATLRSRREALARLVVEEAGKPLALARLEVDRATDTMLDAAYVARYPEIVGRDLSGFASGAGRLALVRRVPIGPVLAITPFNFPLMLVVHKLAPAVAAGCPVVLKPASQTPSAALAVAAALVEAGLPDGALSVLPSAAATVAGLIVDRRFKLLSFTGSAEVGWGLKRLAWDKRVALELGGNAAAIVEPDAGDLAEVAQRLTTGAFSFAGQSCISVQRILVHRSIYNEMVHLLTEATRAFPSGDPADERTLCGPLIDPGNADRVMVWIGSARQAGATLLAGGERSGNVVTPSLLGDVPSDHQIVCDEVFGPVATVAPYDTFEEALARVNESRYGLQAGVFTRDIAKVRRAWDVL